MLNFFKKKKLTALDQRRAQAKKRNNAYPIQGGCGMCERKWAICTPHITIFREFNVAIALCEECWVDLSIPYARLTYYVELYDGWIYQSKFINDNNIQQHFLDNHQWVDLREAVLEGR